MNLFKPPRSLMLLSALLVAITSLCCAAESNTSEAIHLSAIRIEDGSQFSFLLLAHTSSSAPLHVVADDMARDNLSISVQTQDQKTGQLKRAGLGRRVKISTTPAPKPEEITLRPDEVVGRVIRVEKFPPDTYQTAYEMEVSLTLRFKQAGDDSLRQHLFSIPVMTPCK